MRLHRLPKLLAEMGEFTWPRSLVPSERRGKAKPPAVKPKARKRPKLIDHPGPTPYQHTCYSATCAECGRVWLSAIRPIRNNATRNDVKVYLCGKCRITDV